MFSQWLSDQDELFKIISAPCDKKETIQQSKLLNVNPSFCNMDVNVPNKPKQGRRRKLSAFDNIEESPRDDIKKIIHRDVERQRRQEMTGLYQNLRSLIPSEHLEGKRSISDHINGTVRYIRHQKKKIDELKNKREKLKQLLINPISSKVVEDQFPEGRERPSITVKTCWTGIEITVTSSLKGSDLPLSRILNILISENLSIKSCISTRVQGRLFHRIESEVNEERIIDQNELQKKLMDILTV